jgi:hypothetical protein
MNVMLLLLTPVSGPEALPEIGVRPFGNGLSIVVMGRRIFCCNVVVCEYPGVLWRPACQVAQKSP